MAGTHFTTHRIQTWVVYPKREYRDFPLPFQILLLITWLGALFGRELRRVGRVSLLDFPPHPPHSRNDRGRGPASPQPTVTQHHRS